MRDKLDAALVAYEKTKKITNDAELEEALREIASREIAKADGDVELVDLAAAELLILRGEDPERVREDAEKTAAERFEAIKTKAAEKRGKPGVKTKILLLAAAVAAVVSLVVTAGANSIWDLFSDKTAEFGMNVGDLYKTSLESANEEQRPKLEKLFENYGQSANEHEREIRIIMGELPEDTPRLTKEKAIEICKTVDTDPEKYGSPAGFEGEMVRLFNQIAGAPDINGGSGLTFKIYYTDDSENYAIRASGCIVKYCDYLTGENEILLIMQES